MWKNALLHGISFALLAAGGSAWSQQPPPGADFPEGPAKAIVVPMCGACHDPGSRVMVPGRGSAPPDTHRVLRLRAHAPLTAMVLACSAASTGQGLRPGGLARRSSNAPPFDISQLDGLLVWNARRISASPVGPRPTRHADADRLS